jgi:hypothetical protein
MRIPLRGGRTFSSMDRPDAPLAAVINETMARRYWPNADPVGHAVYWGGRRLTIVGVVSDVRVSALDAPVRPMPYNSLFQIASGATQFAVFVVRTRRAEAASALFGAIRRAVWSVDRGLPVFGGTTLDDVVSRALATRRFLVWLLTGFAITAGVLVMVGMYGVLSYAVVQRTRELGVRAALGARPRDAWLLVVRSGLALAAAGIEIRDDQVTIGPATIDGGIAAFSRAWEDGLHPTAILSMSDAMAVGAIRAARDRGISVPADMSVVGFDDIDLAALTDPPLTTVHQPIRQKGEEAVRLLLTLIDRRETTKPEHRRLDTRLIVRGSTGLAPHARQEVAGVQD